MRAYDYRYAVTGIGYHHYQAFGLGRLVDGAHLRPVAAQGSEATTNGLALTPTLHGLFDAGLFTLEYQSEHVVVRRSPELGACDLTPTSTASRLDLSENLPVRLPTRREWWPAPEALHFHQTKIFRK